MCNKCLPPAVILAGQNFRHVDYVSFMNYRDIGSFVGAWQQTGHYEQRMAYLYGYYSEDPNFKDGVRVNIEALYEPPQIGEMNGVQPLDDPQRGLVDMIAESLTLERVGYIYTTLNKDKVFMTSDYLRQSARL
jgi:nuclear protein localization family protein 4